jgi:hypothetical protein
MIIRHSAPHFRATFPRFVGAVKRTGPEETNSGGSPSLSGLEFSIGVFLGAGVSRHHFDCVDGQAVSLDEFGAQRFRKHRTRRRFGELGNGAAEATPSTGRQDRSRSSEWFRDERR